MTETQITDICAAKMKKAINSMCSVQKPRCAGLDRLSWRIGLLWERLLWACRFYIFSLQLSFSFSPFREEAARRRSALSVRKD